MPDSSYKELLEQGRRRFKDGHVMTAKSAFQEAIKMEPSNHQAYVELACLYSEMADAETDPMKKQLLQEKEADVWWRLRKAEDETGVIGLSGLAEHYEGLGEHETADDLYAEVAKRRPDYYEKQYEAALTLIQDADPRGDPEGKNLEAALRTLLRLHKANKNWLEDKKATADEKKRARLQDRKVLRLISQLQIAYGEMQQGMELLGQLSEEKEKVGKA